jgi:hypothetical protein
MEMKKILAAAGAAVIALSGIASIVVLNQAPQTVDAVELQDPAIRRADDDGPTLDAVSDDDNDSTGDGDSTRGDDGTGGGNNTDDGDSTRGDDGTGGGNNTGDGGDTDDGGDDTEDGDTDD